MDSMKKRVAIISPGLSTGGAERVASLLANYLFDKGYAVTFIATSEDDMSYPLSMGVKYNCVDNKKLSGIRKMIYKNIRVRELIKNFKADTLISFVIGEAALSVLTLRIKRILSLRCDPGANTRGLFFKIFRSFLFGLSDMVVFQTADAKAYFSKSIQRKGRIIVNPITSRLPNWKDYTHEKVIITACRLDKHKNIKMLIDAFAMIHDEFPEYKLHIFGKGPIEKELKDYSESKGLGRSVLFMGFSADIHNEMARSMIFALSSNHEGISNSMLEALGIGIPTICTDCPTGGARMFINSYENGILVPVGDTEALYEALRNTIELPSLRERLSNNSVKIRDKLELNKICSLWEEAL